MEKEKKHYVFLNILLLGMLVVIFISFYSFYFKKNFDFFVETQCDPTTETCFFRDCEGTPDLCPPNNLSYYSMYTIKAKDFKFCPDEDCTNTCKTGVINCVQTVCSESQISDGECVTNTLKESEEIIQNNSDN